jgi:hypothetical protein
MAAFGVSRIVKFCDAQRLSVRQTFGLMVWRLTLVAAAASQFQPGVQRLRSSYS